MKFAIDDTSNGYIINGHDAENILINGKRYQRSLILGARTLIDDWPPQSISELTQSHFDQILQLSPEVVLLGTGAKQIFPSPALYQQLLHQGIGVEVMNTAAACRTYNVLLAEDRVVIAALFI